MLWSIVDGKSISCANCDELGDEHKLESGCGLIGAQGKGWYLIGKLKNDKGFLHSIDECPVSVLARNGHAVSIANNWALLEHEPADFDLYDCGVADAIKAAYSSIVYYRNSYDLERGHDNDEGDRGRQT